MKLMNVDRLAEEVGSRIGEMLKIIEQLDHHVFDAMGRQVLIASTSRGNWLCKDTKKPHWHEDDSVLRDRFIETIAAMLRGESACAACPPISDLDEPIRQGLLTK